MGVTVVHHAGDDDLRWDGRCVRYDVVTPEAMTYGVTGVV